jgi:hypothetical protein
VQFAAAGGDIARGYADRVSFYFLRGWFQQKIQIRLDERRLVPIFQETAGKIKISSFFYRIAIFVLQPLIPTTDDLDPLLLLTDDAQIAAWNNEGLPSDRMSTENATILTNSQRWPLMIDPQVILS